MFTIFLNQKESVTALAIAVLGILYVFRRFYSFRNYEYHSAREQNANNVSMERNLRRSRSTGRWEIQRGWKWKVLNNEQVFKLEARLRNSLPLEIQI